MPVYCYKCTNCGAIREVTMTPAQMYEYAVEGQHCPECSAGTFKRSFAAEQAKSHYHPTVDLYANDLKRRAVKNKNLDRAPGWTPGG